MRALKILVAALALAGCAAPSLDLKPSDISPSKAVVADVPLIEQADFFCGPAALAMSAQWAGKDVDQNDIAALSFSPNAQGTFQSDMIGAARRLGLLAVPISGFEALTAEIAMGSPVIVFQDLQPFWVPVWHYAVVTGYDASNETITLHSGQLSRTNMSFDRFGRTWAAGEGWAIVVLPPGKLPETARESVVLDATAGLERAGQLDAAVIAYRAGSQRWPENWLWHFGLGNAYYAQGEKEQARTAWQRALSINPGAEEARQNLATLNQEVAQRG